MPCAGRHDDAHVALNLVPYAIDLDFALAFLDPKKPVLIAVDLFTNLITRLE